MCLQQKYIIKLLNWEELASRKKMHLSLLMYNTANRNVPGYLLINNLFSKACENNRYKSTLRNTEYSVALDHILKTELLSRAFLI